MRAQRLSSERVVDLFSCGCILSERIQEPVKLAAEERRKRQLDGA
jgi:hypothetical protein